MGIIKSFDIKNLLPFHKPGKGVPESIGKEDKIAELDPNLSPEEQVYVAHYLGYADILLAAAPVPEEEPAIEDKIVVMPVPGQASQEPEVAEKTEDDGEAA